jgi:hypothetical protein
MLDVIERSESSAQAQQPPTCHAQLSGFTRTQHVTHTTEHDASSLYFVVSYGQKNSSLSRTAENDSGTEQLFLFPDTSHHR